MLVLKARLRYSITIEAIIMPNWKYSLKILRTIKISVALIFMFRKAISDQNENQRITSIIALLSFQDLLLILCLSFIRMITQQKLTSKLDRVSHLLILAKFPLMAILVLLPVYHSCRISIICAVSCQILLLGHWSLNIDSFPCLLY